MYRTSLCKVWYIAFLMKTNQFGLIPVFLRHIVSAHRPMGACPPPHGRAPTAPWALAHRAVGADYVPKKNGNLPRRNNKVAQRS